MRSEAKPRQTMLPMKGAISDPKTYTKYCDNTPQATATKPFMTDIELYIELSALSECPNPSLWYSETIHASNTVKSKVVLTPPRIRPTNRIVTLEEAIEQHEIA